MKIQYICDYTVITTKIDNWRQWDQTILKGQSDKKKQGGNYKTSKRVQKGKLKNIEGIMRKYQKETKAVIQRTDNSMYKSLQMSKGKSIMVKQTEYIPFNCLKKRKQTMICKALHKKLSIEQQKTLVWTQTILCHMLNSKTKQSKMTKTYCDITCGLLLTQTLWRRY